MSATFTFPMPLCEKYRPRLIADFVGLDKPKRILSKFAANPYESAWLFVGPPGTGKTSMALALAESLRAEIHHIPSQQCNVANVEDVIHLCWYVPQLGGFHLVLVDEADKMSNAAQLHFLSKLDATAFPPKTIFVFTCNTTDGLEARFLSRTRQIEFSSYGLASESNSTARIDLEPRGKWRIGTQSRPHRQRFFKQHPRCANDVGNRVVGDLSGYGTHLEVEGDCHNSDWRQYA